MKPRDYAFLYLVGLIICVGVSIFQNAPGYMDADYYASGGKLLAEGYGFWEPFRWNYLDSYNQIPHPSHLYWMPLASLISWMGIKISGDSTFTGTRLFFIILAGFVPLITAWIGYSFSNKRSSGMLAGLLAVFPGLYLPYYSTTDTFAVSMILGAIFIQTSWLAFKSKSAIGSFYYFGGLGIIAGLLHMARADGLLWFFFGVFIWLRWELIIGNHRQVKSSGWKMSILSIPTFLSLLRGIMIPVGYILVMAPWYFRNITFFGALFPDGSNQTMWLTSYNEMFLLDPSKINFSSWFATSLSAKTNIWMNALSLNSQRIIAEQGMVFLLPLIISGIWVLRCDFRINLTLLIWFTTFFVMTFVFAFAGPRGGLFHSTAALQPVLWATVPMGLDKWITWGVINRGWKTTRAKYLFSSAIVLLAIMVSGIFFFEKVLDPFTPQSLWDEEWRNHISIGQTLTKNGFGLEELGFVNNPPGFYWATGRSTLVIPEGDVLDLHKAAKDYGATYLILEKDHVQGLAELYCKPTSGRGLEYLETIQDYHLFKIIFEN